MSKQMETRCIHGNSDFSYREGTRAVSFPIYRTATFSHIGLGLTAWQAAYTSGGPWLEQCHYLRASLDYLCSFLEQLEQAVFWGDQS